MDNQMSGAEVQSHNALPAAVPSTHPAGVAASADLLPVSALLTSLEIAMTGQSEYGAAADVSAATATEPTPVPAPPVHAPKAAGQTQWAAIGHRVTLHYDTPAAAEVDDGHITAEALLLPGNPTRLKPVDSTGFPWNLGVVQEVAQAALVLIPSRALGNYRQEADAWLTLATELPSSTPIEGGDAEEFAVWIEQLGYHGKSMGSPAGLKEILSMALLSIRTRAVEDLRFAATLPPEMRA